MPDITEADGALFERLRPRLKAISRRILGSEADAEDVVQDCYLKWQAAERALLATPAAWLTTVVQRLSIDRLRRRARDAAAAQAAMEGMAVVPPLPDEALLQRADLGEALARLLAALSPAERLALVLHEVFECGHADIAAALGTTAVNARQYLSRARRRLRARDGEAPPDEKLCRELVRRFQAAINGLDLPEVVSLLAAEQPLCVREAAPVRAYGVAARQAANQAHYGLALAA